MSIHLQGVTPGSLGEATLLVGDPGRIPLVTDHWQNVTELCRNREFVVCSGTYEDKLFSVCSTGIGLGSTEIAVMELIENGAQAFVRVGGCGSWREDIPAGALLFNHAMIRDKSLLHAYVDDNYPAAADPLLWHALYQEARRQKKQAFYGIGFTAGTYYLGQGRSVPWSENSAESKLMTDLKARGVINCDMETAVIYTLASLYNIPAANCLVCHVNRDENVFVSQEDYQEMHREAAGLVLKALTSRTRA